MVCATGCDDFGISTVCAKFPPASAVLEPAVEVSNSRLTVSAALNPQPDTVTFMVGVPMAGEMETEAANAKLAVAVTRITTNARGNRNVRGIRANLRGG